MLDVYITVDTEIWCDGWDNLDKNFLDSFQRYVYGKTSNGNYALPMTLEILRDNGLKGVFFVEPLFSARFGSSALEEMVGLIKDQKQEIQLHIHTEWLDEATCPIFPEIKEKKQFLYQFDEHEQTTIIKHGLDLLREVGVPNITAFRAGSYAANADTLKALKTVGISVDTSYNPAANHLEQSIFPNKGVHQREVLNETCVYPVGAIDDGRGQRHLQVTACSLAEFKYALDTAEKNGWDSLVIVTHNFELMNQAKNGADFIVCKRFQKLCEYLNKNTDRFRTCWFNGAPTDSFIGAVEPLKSKRLLTGLRYVEQGLRRVLVG